MARAIEAPNSISALGRLISLILDEGSSLPDRLEVLSVLVSVTRSDSLVRLESFRETYEEIVGNQFWTRAEQLYTSRDPLSWKVSYRNRVFGEDTQGDGSQMESILHSMKKKPGSNTLTFSFYRPLDHRRARAMPASMPCPISGDFKFRKGLLHLNMFYRTHDAYRLGFPDLYFSRVIQTEVLTLARAAAPRSFSESQVGELDLFLSRAFVLKKHRTKAEKLLSATQDVDDKWASQ